jgi:hypothetical protein
MGLFARLIGLDKDSAAINALLASDLIEAANNDLRQQITQGIADIAFEVYYGKRTREELLEDLSNRTRVVQMQFVALACNNLGISPNVPKIEFNRVDNPYWAEGRVTEDILAFYVRFIEKRSGVRINWPGDSVK